MAEDTKGDTEKAGYQIAWFTRPQSDMKHSFGRAKEDELVKG